MTNPSPLSLREAAFTDAFDCARAALFGPDGLSRSAVISILSTLRERVDRVLSQEADSTAPASERDLFEQIGREMVRITTTVRGPDEWLCIPELWLRCAQERDDLRATLSSTAPVVSSDEGAIRGVINELRWYNPAADAYRGKHIHKGWADRLDAALSPPPQTPTPVAPEPAREREALMRDAFKEALRRYCGITDGGMDEAFGFFMAATTPMGVLTEEENQWGIETARAALAGDKETPCK